MSILFRNQHGWIISHEEYFSKIPVQRPCCCSSDSSNTNTGFLCSCADQIRYLKLSPQLFNIWVPFKQRKTLISDQSQDIISGSSYKSKKRRRLQQEIGSGPDKELHSVQELGNNLIKQARLEQHNIFMTDKETETEVDNSAAITIANDLFNLENESESEFHGQNSSNTGLVTKLNGHNYVIPGNTVFHCRNVDVIHNHLKEQFDLIVMDPPWRNKYIRRRKRKQAEAGYQSLENRQIQEIPIESMTKENSLVVVWCTNSRAHQTQVVNQFFPKWGLELCGKWFWLKITKSGKPVTPFNPSDSTLKQPFEMIIIGRRTSLSLPNSSTNTNTIRNDEPKVIVSIPSSINSHKPPLVHVLEDYFNINTVDLKCCELFARSLTPGWTSYGNQVLKLQDELLYSPC